jgi:hypothetical protein
VLAVPSIPGVTIAPAARLREVPDLVGTTAGDLGGLLA